jgi:ectoine hydroxylase-related dioxygenase (phytanoyl-CoA dioxygenase family)
LLAFETDEFTPFNALEWTIPVEDNNIIIFPSTLHHYVKANSSDKNRLSIAFNTFVRGNIRTQFNGADLILK